MQKLLDEQDVILDFEGQINSYCEQLHLSEGIPRYKICKIVVEKFKSKYSADFIRRKVSDIYKVSHKANNAKKKGKSLKERLIEKAKNIDNQIKEMSNETVAFVEKN